jgi:hypothetical protein
MTTDKKTAHPVLDERFITTIKGKEFVLYAGLLDLAHQKGLKGIHVEAIQYPTKENGMEGICKAIVESQNGESSLKSVMRILKTLTNKLLNMYYAWRQHVQKHGH